MPVGLMETAEFTVVEQRLTARRQDRDLQRRRHRGAEYGEAVSSARSGCGRWWKPTRANPAPRFTTPIQEAVATFTEGAPQSDDITVVVLEFWGTA